LGGYTAIAIVVSLAGLWFEFDDVSLLTYGVILALGLLSMSVSVLAAAFLRWRPTELVLPVQHDGRRARMVLLTLVVTYVPLAAYTAIGQGGLWSSEAAESLSSGVLGHMHVALALATIWYAISNRDGSALRIAILIGAFGGLSLYPVKGWTLVPLAAVVIASFIRSRRGWSTIAYPVSLLALATLLFFGIYLSRVDWDSSNPELVSASVSLVFEHMIFYLTAGFMGLNAIVHGLRLHGGLDTIFAPFVNFVQMLQGGERPVTVISDVYVQGMTDQGQGGNVYSFVGTLVGYTAPGIGLAFAGLFVAIGYVILGCAWRTGASVLRAAAVYGTAVFAFGWFEYYFWHLTPLEILLLALLCSLPSLAKRRRPECPTTLK